MLFIMKVSVEGKKSKCNTWFFTASPPVLDTVSSRSTDLVFQSHPFPTFPRAGSVDKRKHVRLVRMGIVL